MLSLITKYRHWHFWVYFGYQFSLWLYFSFFTNISQVKLCNVISQHLKFFVWVNSVNVSIFPIISYCIEEMREKDGSGAHRPRAFILCQCKMA